MPTIDSGSRPPPHELVAPTEPVEDSADDPVPEDPCGTETDAELDAAEKAEPPPVVDLPPEEKRYRKHRLSDREIIPRVRRRYGRAVKDADALDDLVQDTFLRAHTAQLFPLPHETIFPWIYKSGSAARKRQMRHLLRERERHVSLEHVDRHRHVAASDLDGVPDSLEAHQQVVQEILAASPADQQTLELYRQQEIEEVPAAIIAQENGLSVAAYHQRTSRLNRKLQKTLLERLSMALMLLFAAGLLYYATRNILPHDPDVANPNDLPHAPKPAPTVAPPPAPEDPHARARELRTKGLEECTAGEWESCVESLQAAIHLDGSLASDPVVTRAVQNAGREMNLKGPR